ncbi:CPBP family glutamic-type intramembrane protease [Microbispora sp. ATCC PTA-5024]|uniref:CPBP family glutamic-type intramembrane protease n=1 Tax=Microbispora sp. ATCC PTA-5024 TaxID=316330 RepID=UPI0003DB711B|nr:CPBP family glutamic-type intramembrane protease [Microbispora sp. ATCC PTA-5024]ETK33242.1 abortive phage infection protein [Microbispora sp. ATCC PTA-5024]
MRRADPLVVSAGVLAAANVLNNRVARRWAPLTSAAATAALLAVARREGLGWAELGFGRARRGAVVGGALAAGVAAVYAAGVALPRTRPLFHDERALGLSRARVLEEALVQVPFGTVLLEEVGFRGVLPALFGRVLPAGAAAAASAGLFGLWHVLPALDMARANLTLGRLAAGESPDLEHAASAAPAKAGDVGTARLVAGTVLSTSAAGMAFHELRRRSGLLAPSLLHLATNSLGYAAARLAARIGPGRTGQEPGPGSASP